MIEGGGGALGVVTRRVGIWVITRHVYANKKDHHEGFKENNTFHNT